MVPNAVSFRSWESTQKKSISDNARDRKLAAAQIRLPTFDKRKRANFVHPSNGCNPIHSSRGYENARARAGEAERGVRGKSFQPLDSLMEGEEKKRSSNSFYGRKEARCTFSTPLLSRVDRALEVRTITPQGRINLGWGQRSRRRQPILPL